MMPRSWLCASALKSTLLDKARETGADVAVIDLEDAVPAAAKHAARLALRAHFEKAGDWSVAVRINSLATYEGLTDLLFLLDQDIVPDFLVLPKVILPHEVTLAATLFDERGVSSVEIFGIIETTSALCSLRTLETAPRRLAGLQFGAADFAADLGVPLEDSDLRFARQEVALAARRLGIAAIDSPCFALKNTAQVESEAREARLLGFAGKVAIHPAQVPTINSVFTPTAQMLDRARRLVAAARREPGQPVFEVEDQMVGPPFVKYAERLLAELPNSERCSTG